MKTYFFAFLLLSQLIFAQKIPVEQVIQKFEKSQLTWEMPLNNKKVSVFWQERISTFSSEGIKTFVGYADNQMIGVISVQKNTISGSVRYLGKQFLFSTENNFFVIKKETIKDKCGVCEGEYCSASHSFSKNDNLLNISDVTSRKTARLQIDDVPEIHSDGILRVYRLAILVDYNLFRNTAGSDVNRIKQFWAETETFLNELYIRDLSIKFEVVKDDRLIRKTIADRVFQDSQTPDEITNQATAKINDIIGEKSYDVGVVASSGRGGLNGIAALFLAYSKHGKAQAWVSVLQPVTVAHELGHLFGASHTYSEGGAYDSMNTEPRRGQSVMSYSRTLPRDFFSLPSINTIRKAIQNNADYYTDEARTNRVGPQNSENIVYGIPSNNQAPVINRSQLKSEYTLPQGTYFQFHIPATDPDGHSLRYMAHQADIRLKERFSFAIVRSAKPQADPTVIFYHQYYITDNQTVASVENAIPNFPITGNNNERTFWLGVSDAGALAQNPNHAVRYDMFPTKVKFVDGTAFKILTDVKKTYNAGEKITLRWGADMNVFGANSKVKISMSDDFGQTWKYVLAPETPNDGSEEITIPHIELGRKQHAPTISSGLGLIKIEVIGHIAVAVSNNHPITGGFEIKKSEISFENLPPQFISVKQGEEPQKADVIAKTTCATPSVSVSYKEEKQSETILARIWEANDTCGNTATFTQYIEVKKSVQPLRFVGELPQNVHIQCVSQSVENPQMLTVTGGASPTISFTQTKLEGDYENYTLKRTWIATDPDAAPISHTQIVVINDGEKPVLSAYPPSATVKSVEEMPQNPSVTATDNCDGNVEVEVTGYLEIAGGKNTYVNSWTAKDKSGNTVRHEQRITIDPNYVAPTSKITFSASETLTLQQGDALPNPYDISATSTCNTDNLPNKTQGTQIQVNTQSEFINAVKTARNGDTIKLMQNVGIMPDNSFPHIMGSFEPFVIDKSVVIEGNTANTSLTFNRGLPLEVKADVTFRNMSLEMIPESGVDKTFIYADDNQIVFDNVRTKVSARLKADIRPTIIAGSYKNSHFSGKGAKIIIKNTPFDGAFATIYAGSYASLKTTNTIIEIQGAETSFTEGILAKGYNGNMMQGNTIIHTASARKNTYQGSANGKTWLHFNNIVNRQFVEVVDIEHIILTGSADITLSEKSSGLKHIAISDLAKLTLLESYDLQSLEGSGTLVVSYQKPIVVEWVKNQPKITIKESWSVTDNQELLSHIMYGVGQPNTIVYQHNDVNYIRENNTLSVASAQHIERHIVNNLPVIYLGEERTISGENEIITRVWQATDACGVIATHTQTITIKPRPVQPIVWVENSLPKNTKVSCENIPAITTNLQANGGCSTLTISHKSDEISAKICANLYRITRLYEAKDNCGNSKMHMQTIEVEDVTKPTFVGTLPQNIEIFEDENIPAQENLTATDNCGTATVTKTESREIGKVTYIWTAKDDCGNEVTHNQIITIKPRPIQPIVWVENSLPKNTKVSCENIPVIATSLQANGGCSTLTISHKSDEISAKICANLYRITRLYEAKDNCGNSKMHMQTIEVEDVTKPTFVGNLPQNIEIFEDETIPTQGNLTATDNCGTATVTKTETREIGKVTYIWTAKDDCGNEVTHNQIITIKPRPIQPIVWVENSLPKNTKVSCENIPVIATNLQANGGCSTLTISHKSDEISAKICTNSYQITRLYEAKDNCGNSKMHMQTIEVEDVTKPTFVGNLPQNIEIFEDETIPTQGNLTATDNCGTATVTKTESREIGKVTYIWTAKDDCGNEVVHTQIITLKKKEKSEVPKNPEIPKNPNPIKNSAEMVIYNAISTENGSENYFRIENLSENSVVRVQIFSNLGEKVFESDTYGQNNVFFRGYSNVKDISNTEKLPEGVYYYLLWINNEPKPRKGYLYVR